MNRPANRFREAFEGGFLVLAHRGDSFHAPENTLDAAALAFQGGAIAWEFDVQSTRDGVPIVLHDPSLMRTTDVAEVFEGDPRGDLGYLAAEFTLEEIRRLDAGRWFVAGDAPRSSRWFGTIDRLDLATVDRCRSRAVRVPTLEEALELTGRSDAMANVEVKSGHDGDFRLVGRVIDLIGRMGLADRVLISSFDHDEVARVFERCPTIATGVLTTTPLHRPEHYVREVVGADAYHVSSRSLGADGAAYLRDRSAASLRVETIERCRRAGVPVLVYTVNEAGENKEAGHLAEAGVAGLFTDDPRTILDQFTPSSGHTRRHSGGAAHPEDAP